MDKSEYDLLMSEIDRIAEKVSAFPASMQEMVYRNIVDTLLSRRAWDRTRSSTLQGSALKESDAARRRLRNYLAHGGNELSENYVSNDIGSASDMVYAAWVAFFFSDLAPENVRKEYIDYRDLLTVSEFLARPIKDPKSTLNNSRRAGEYLDSVRPGRYAVSEKGLKELEKLRKEEAKK